MVVGGGNKFVLLSLYGEIDLKNISRLESTHDTFEVALDIYKVILEQLDIAQQEKQNQDKGGDNSQHCHYSEHYF